MRKRKHSYSVEQLQNAVNNSLSYAGCLRFLGLNIFGSAYETLKRELKINNISTSHFRGCGWLKGKTHSHGKKIPIVDIIYENKYPYFSTTKLKNRLIKEGIMQHVCISCNLSEWMNGKIPLELDHINGNKENHHISNLRLLCPNCHALTPTHAGKNMKIKAKVSSVVATLHDGHVEM